MNTDEQKRFDLLYAQHQRLLKLHGYAPATIDGYSRAVRRLAEAFDCVPDQLSTEQLQGVLRYPGRYPFVEYHQDRSQRPALLLGTRPQARLDLAQNHQGPQDSVPARCPFSPRGSRAHYGRSQAALPGLRARHLFDGPAPR